MVELCSWDSLDCKLDKQNRSLTIFAGFFMIILHKDEHVFLFIIKKKTFQGNEQLCRNDNG